MNTLLGALIVLTLGVSWFAYISRNMLPSIAAFALWIATWYYLQSDPVSYPVGANNTTIILLASIGIGAYLLLRSLYGRESDNRNPFTDAKNTVRNITVSNEPKRHSNERETPEEYRLRARRALNSHRG